MSIPPDWTRWTYDARVLDIHDGVTMRVAIDLGCGVAVTETIRLLGIQCPEVGGAGVTEDEKRAGHFARLRLCDLVVAAGDRVVVRTKKDTREGRGRYLATVYAVGPDGMWTDLCQQLVDEGHAVAYDGRGRAPKWTPEGWRAAS